MSCDWLNLGLQIRASPAPTIRSQAPTILHELVRPAAQIRGKIRLPGFPEFVSTRGGAYLPAEPQGDPFSWVRCDAVDQTGKSHSALVQRFHQVIGLAQMREVSADAKFRPGDISRSRALARPDCLSPVLTSARC